MVIQMICSAGITDKHMPRQHLVDVLLLVQQHRKALQLQNVAVRQLRAGQIA